MGINGGGVLVHRMTRPPVLQVQNPAQRMSARQALQHPWICARGSVEQPEDDDDDLLFLDKADHPRDEDRVEDGWTLVGSDGPGGVLHWGSVASSSPLGSSPGLTTSYTLSSYGPGHSPGAPPFRPHTAGSGTATVPLPMGGHLRHSLLQPTYIYGQPDSFTSQLPTPVYGFEF